MTFALRNMLVLMQPSVIAAIPHRPLVELIKVPKNFPKVLLLDPVLLSIDDSDLGKEIESVLVMPALEDDLVS